MIRASVDGLATSPSAGPITGLDKEVWDDPVSPDGKRIIALFRDRDISDGRKWYLPVEDNTVVITLTKGCKRRGWRNGGRGSETHPPSRV